MVFSEGLITDAIRNVYKVDARNDASSVLENIATYVVCSLMVTSCQQAVLSSQIHVITTKTILPVASASCLVRMSE